LKMDCGFLMRKTYVRIVTVIIRLKYVIETEIWAFDI